jgi:hypothetical protein
LPSKVITYFYYANALGLYANSLGENVVPEEVEINQVRDKALENIMKAYTAQNQIPDDQIRRPWENVTSFAISALRFRMTSLIDTDRYGKYNYTLYNKILPKLLRDCTALSADEAVLEPNRIGILTLSNALSHCGLNDLAEQLRTFYSRAKAGKKNITFAFPQSSKPPLSGC